MAPQVHRYIVDTSCLRIIPLVIFVTNTQVVREHHLRENSIHASFKTENAPLMASAGCMAR
jgi:hypothetical protein